ncbi:MAG: Fic family protein [Nitrospira sp.]|nr:Fic family protein [Nitrospira sp.]
MKQEDFLPSAPGRLVPIPEGCLAFIPNPLPPLLNLNWEIADSLSEARGALGQLSGVGRMLPNPHLLIKPFLKREAIISSRIEGTIVTEEELALFAADSPGKVVTPDVKEVANYVIAMEHGIQRLTSLPVSLRLIRELHDKLLSGARGGERRPGEFRNRQNFIGLAGQTIRDARFVPAPVDDMNAALDALERFISEPDQIPILIKLALIHYQFETIHPFFDGNGRIGRLLIILLLVERKLLPLPLLYLSAYFERYKREYMDHLLSVSQRGTWNDWINYFLKGIIVQSQDAIDRANNILGLWQSYRKRIQSNHSSNLVLKLVDELFYSPALSAPTMANRLEASTEGVQMAINKLVKEGILKEATGKKRYRIYLATEIFDIMRADRATPPAN